MSVLYFLMWAVHELPSAIDEAHEQGIIGTSTLIVIYVFRAVYREWRDRREFQKYTMNSGRNRRKNRGKKITGADTPELLYILREERKEILNEIKAMSEKINNNENFGVGHRAWHKAKGDDLP